MKQIIKKHVIPFRVFSANNFEHKNGLFYLEAPISRDLELTLLYLGSIPQNSTNSKKISCYLLADEDNTIIEISFYYSFFSIIFGLSGETSETDTIDIYFYYKDDPTAENYNSVLIFENFDENIISRFVFSSKIDESRFLSNVTQKNRWR